MSTEIFQASLLVYLIILLVENFQKAIISDFINLNWLLGIIIISGILMIFLSKKEDNEQEIVNNPVNWRDYSLIFILAIISAVLILMKIKDLGWLAWVISILSGLIICLISYLIINDQE